MSHVDGAAVSGRVHRRTGRVRRADRRGVPGGMEHRLEQRREYRRRGAWMNYPRAGRRIGRGQGGAPWLAEVPGHCLQQTLMDLDKACRTHGTFRVRWRSGRRWAAVVPVPRGQQDGRERLNRRHARVKLPKLGWVKFRLSRPLDDVIIRSATLTRDGSTGLCLSSSTTGTTPPPPTLRPVPR